MKPGDRRATMVRGVLGAMAVAVAVAPAGLIPGRAAASAAFTNTFALGFGSATPGGSTGLNTQMSWSDPGAPFGVPAVLSRIVITFPAGTALDTAAVPTCGASAGQLFAEQTAACPADSRIGGGTSVGALPDGTQLHTTITLFNAPGQIIVLVVADGITATSFRDDVSAGTITVDPILPPGVSLEQLSLVIDPHTSASGAAYLRTPSICPASGTWTISAAFSYHHGPGDTRTSQTPCTAPARPDRRRPHHRRPRRPAHRRSAG